MKSGTVYMPNTARHSTTATVQASQRQRQGRGMPWPGEVEGALLAVDMGMFGCKGRVQAGWAAPRGMGLSRTGRFTSPANTPSAMAMYQTIS